MSPADLNVVSEGQNGTCAEAEQKRVYSPYPARDVDAMLF